MFTLLYSDYKQVISDDVVETQLCLKQVLPHHFRKYTVVAENNVAITTDEVELRRNHPSSQHSQWSQSINQSLIQWTNRLCTLLFAHSFSHSFSHSFTHSFSHSFFHSLFNSLIHFLMSSHFFSHSLSRSFARSFVYPEVPVLGIEDCNPQILGRGSWGSQGGSYKGGSYTGREILLYLIMYRKYVRKW